MLADASAAFIWATIARVYAARRSGVKKEMFGYDKGGYDKALSVFEHRMQKDSIDIRCNANVKAIHSTPEDKVVVETEDRSTCSIRLFQRFHPQSCQPLCRNSTDSKENCTTTFITTALSARRWF